MLFAVWCFYHSTFSAQRYDNFQERQKHTLINLLFWREWNLPLAKFLSVENNKPLKDLRTVWMIGFQVKTYYLCCSLFLLFRQSFISVAGCSFKPSRWIGKGFGAVYSPTEEETAPNGLPLDLFLFPIRIGYLCIRQWDKWFTMELFTFYSSDSHLHQSLCTYFVWYWTCSEL